MCGKSLSEGKKPYGVRAVREFLIIKRICILMMTIKKEAPYGISGDECEDD